MESSGAGRRRPDRRHLQIDSSDIAIIGGGKVGVSAAAFLAEAGISVRLVERAGIAAGASGRNSGAVQHPFDPQLAGLHRETLDIYRALADEGSDFKLIGAASGLDRLFVCAGHRPWGISTRPASARLVVDEMLGRGGVEPELAAARFSS